MQQGVVYAQPDAYYSLRTLALAERSKHIKQTEIGLQGKKYYVVQVPQDTELGIAMTDLKTQATDVRVGLNLDRFAKLHDFTMDLLQRRMRREQVPLMPKATQQECGLLVQAVGEVKAPRKNAFLTVLGRMRDAQVQQMQSIVNGFFEEEELRSVTSARVDSYGRFQGTAAQSRLVDLGYMMSVYVLRLLRDRAFLDQGAQMLGAERDRWKTAEVRDHFVPMQIIVATSLFKEGQTNIIVPEDEIRQVIRAVERTGLRIMRVGFTELQGRWAKDSRLWLPHIDGQPYYYLVPEKVDVPGISPQRIFDPKLRETVVTNISEGGVTCKGIARTPFMVFGDSVNQRQVIDLERTVKEKFPVYSNMRFYNLPSGFVTVRHNSRTYLLDNQHLDTVIGFIPRKFTDHDRDIVLIDPRYYAEIQANPKFRQSFQKFVDEQKIMVVPVVRNGTHDETPFNPTNFIEASDNMLVFNYCPETIKALRLREGMYTMIPTEALAVKALPVMGGTSGCIATRMEITDQNRARFSEPPAPPAPPEPVREERRIREMVREMLPRNPPGNIGLAEYNRFREGVIDNALLVERGFDNEGVLERFVREAFDAFVRPITAQQQGVAQLREAFAVLVSGI